MIRKTIWTSALIIIFFLLCFPAIAYCQFNTCKDSLLMASGDSLSAQFDLKGKELKAVRIPSAISGNQLVIYTSEHPDSIYKRVQYNGADVTLSITAGLQCGLKPEEVGQLLRYIKFASRNSGSTQTQAAARYLKPVIK